MPLKAAGSYHLPVFVLLLISSLARGQLIISVAERDAEQRDLMFDQSRNRTISLAPGLTYVIACTIDNVDSFPSNPWTRDGSDVNMMSIEDANENNPLVFYDDSDYSSKKDLYLIKFDSTLTGEYICQSDDNSKTLTITASNPAIILDNIYVEGNVKKSFTVIIKTILYGNPVPQPSNVTWFFDGSPLNAEDLGISMTVVGEDSIFNFVFKRIQTGLYTAVVSTSAGTSNDSFTLQVFTPPIVSFTSDCNCLSNDEIIVAKNSSFNLSCVDTNSDPLPEFTWLKDDDILESSNYIRKEVVLPTEYRLVFSNILPEHAGMYICKATNTKQKDMKGVTINVKYAPQVSAVSPSSIAVPVGREIQLLVEYGGGFPDPQVSWSHYNGVERFSVSENSRAQQHGLFGINLTISDVSVGDEGTYTLEVNNTVETIVLEFNVTVLVPPTLLRLSNLTTHSPVGGTAVFIVGVVDAQPPVVESNLVWKGNFNSSQGQMTFENEEAVLELSDLKLSDSGNVTLTVEHTGGNVQLYYELIVLNVPDAPSLVNIQSNGTCLVEVSWGTSEPPPTTALTDEVMLEQQICSYRDATCDEQKWELLQVYPSDIQSASVPLLPDKNYSFRLAGCSDLVGCGDPWTVPERVNTIVEGFFPRVTDLAVNPLSSSNISVTWTKPVQGSDCYELVNYTAMCWSLNQPNRRTSITVPSEGSGSHKATFMNLESDNRYNCTVAPVYSNRLGTSVQLGTSPALGTGDTNPREPPTEDVEIEIDRSDTLKEGTVAIDLVRFRDSLNKDEVSHIHIIVQRLGNSPTLPSESPDELYHTLNDFSTYKQVHSLEDMVKYPPYITAEINVGDIPDSFTVGSENNINDRRRQEYTNGPLNPSDHYTVFIRMYSRSQFGKQYSVFTSTSFTPPFQSSSGNSDCTKSSCSDGASGETIAATVIVILLVVGVVVGLIIAGLVVYKVRRGKHQTRSAPSTGNGIIGIPLNQYTNISEVKGQSKSPPPDLPSTDPPKKRPLHVTNPIIDSDCEKGIGSDGEDKKSLSMRLPSTPSSRSQTPAPLPAATAANHHDRKLVSNPVAREEFQHHLGYLDSNDQQLFEKEFLSIQRHSYEHQADASSCAHMHGKNRYKNITAFDYTRVCLSPVQDVSDSDYINANYIKGYDDKKSYIATQGPTEETHVDFWRMVWEQNTATIVMLTNLEEKGKSKCFKYWPSGERQAYENIVVRVDRDIVLPYYTIRSFKLINAVHDQGERTVIQFHYTAWPDKNVPALASPVLDFLRAINSANDPTRHGPIIVHCSAGVGRTGTIIALDICLEQMMTEGRIDIQSVVSFLREQRTQMVQTQSQYIFIHHAILEDIVYGDSTVLLKNFPEKYLKLQASHCALIEEEFKKIAMVRPPAQANTGPNEIQLELEAGVESNGFSAFGIDGYWYRNLFVACSSPMSDNLELFWKLVWQKKCSHVINISQKTPRLFNYLPESGKQMILGDLEVNVEKMDYRTGYILRIITISTNESNETLTIKHMQYEDWLSKQLPRVDKLVKFVAECVREVSSFEQDGRPILVHDNGSWSQVGILITLLNCFERVKKERLVDLLQAINCLHLQCPTSIQSLELAHYAFCYDCLHEFCGKLLRESSEPPIYENIASFRGRLMPSPEPVEEKLLKDYDIL